ncbi:ATP-binding protein [Streptomyces sp. TRM70350]|uniref:ATP-binding protein n=1 Tax=Streptomyces sp. TRM70350 TaxID=2856165 RepID=UPI001C43D597|nr:ATP-binding protein [Streptomyces sp. TRM70350]MBV7699761.1 ATP-binding protein [Streptomyces sp. TRM70350]
MDRTDVAAPARPCHRTPGDAHPAGPVHTAAEARAYARSVVLDEWNSAFRTARERDVIDLQLVVSELVSNAIRHGGGLAGFEATATPEGVRLAVHDHSAAVPAAAFGPGDLPRGHQGSGYGWPLIIRLARDIVVEPRPEGGKTIRVLVPLRAEADQAPG